MGVEFAGSGEARSSRFAERGAIASRSAPRAVRAANSWEIAFSRAPLIDPYRDISVGNIVPREKICLEFIATSPETVPSIRLLSQSSQQLELCTRSINRLARRPMAGAPLENRGQLHSRMKNRSAKSRAIPSVRNPAEERLRPLSERSGA